MLEWGLGDQMGLEQKQEALLQQDLPHPRSFTLCVSKALPLKGPESPVSKGLKSPT